MNETNPAVPDQPAYSHKVLMRRLRHVHSTVITQPHVSPIKWIPEGHILLTVMISDIEARLDTLPEEPRRTFNTVLLTTKVLQSICATQNRIINCIIPSSTETEQRLFRQLVLDIHHQEEVLDKILRRLQMKKKAYQALDESVSNWLSGLSLASQPPSGIA